MERIPGSIQVNTSSELLSLKHNISQLARQLETEKHKTKIEDDKKYWIL